MASNDFKVEIADSQNLRELGLGGRDSLNSSDGMLFVFDTPGIYGFWMKDMKFDLDIVWMDKEGRVIGIEKNVSKSSYPTIYYPPKQVVYALEMKAGSTDEWRIKTDDLLSPTF